MDSAAPSHFHMLVIARPSRAADETCEILQGLGHRTSRLPEAEEALAWLETGTADLIVFEATSPGDFKRCGSFRGLTRNRWVPIVVITPLVGDEHVVAALAGGADECLTSPVNPALLSAKLRLYARSLALQARLASLAQRQRDIQDNILDAVLTVDEAGMVVEANLAACQVFARGTPAGLVGNQIQVLTGVPLEALSSGGRLTLHRADQLPFPAQACGSEWVEDGFRRITLVIRDLTETLRNERMRDEFLATVSHELRTPLTSVLGAVGLLVSGAAGKLPPAALPLAAAAQRNGERLGKLIDDVLDLTKLEGDRMTMRLQPQDLAPLVHEAAAANQGYAQRCGVQLKVELDDGGSLAATRSLVDADRLLQVMANLVSNALKHSPRGGTVVLRLGLVAARQCISVSDDGPGVPAAFRAALFEKFSQADTSDRRSIGGTGLGLHIARLLVERMGGSIDIEQEKRQGATFRVWLPALIASAAAQADTADMQPAPAATGVS